MRGLLERLERLEAVRGRTPARVPAAEQANVHDDLRQLRPGLDVAELMRDILDPARRGRVALDVLRVVARTQLEDVF